MIAQFVGRPLGRSESIRQIIHTVQWVKTSNFSIYFRQLKNRRSRPNGIIKKNWQVSSNRPTTSTLLMFNDTSRGLLYQLYECIDKAKEAAFTDWIIVIVKK